MLWSCSAARRRSATSRIGRLCAGVPAQSLTPLLGLCARLSLPSHCYLSTEGTSEAHRRASFPQSTPNDDRIPGDSTQLSPHDEINSAMRSSRPIEGQGTGDSQLGLYGARRVTHCIMHYKVVDRASTRLECSECAPIVERPRAGRAPADAEALAQSRTFCGRQCVLVSREQRWFGGKQMARSALRADSDRTKPARWRYHKVINRMRRPQLA